MIKISLAAARVNAGMTQKQIADKMHVNKSTVIRWESGKSEIKATQLHRFCEITGIPEAYIFLPTMQL